MPSPPVVIIGAGLAGLSAARALRRRGVAFLVLEREARVGGLCRTEHVGGYAFDYTGHLLHLQPGPVRDMVLDLLGDRLVEHQRRASVYLAGTFVPYPIQAHFGCLPGDLVDRCLADFRKAKGPGDRDDLSFPDWARAQFGDALADIFMVPYNQKLYRHPLEEMEPSWTSWSVPRPTVEEMENTARGQGAPTYGYNATFWYPRRGGIDVLPEILAREVADGLRLGRAVRSVDVHGAVVILEGGEEIGYRSLISTVPLPDLLRMTGRISGVDAGAPDRLRHSSVAGWCIGFDRPALRDDHWIYFPEGRFPFYRVGFFTNFSPALAPEGCSSLYAEVAHLPGGDRIAEGQLEDIVAAVKEAGLVPGEARVTVHRVLPMPCAYVFYDRYRLANLKTILDGLRRRSVLSVGRYGAWEYSAMGDAIEWGVRAAEEVLA